MDLLECATGTDPAKHWYYQVKADALTRELGRFNVSAKSIIDVGAGTGFFSQYLLDQLPQAHASCIDPNYSDEFLAMSSDRLTFSRESADASGDLYLFMDVLEHVEDDLALLDEYVKTAPDGAYFYITVPAFQSLWSAHDVYLKHFRRYRLKQLEQVALDANLEVLHGRYLYGLTFPAVAAVRTARKNKEAQSDMKQPSPMVNRIAGSLLRGENRLPGNRIAGSTATILARKS